MVEPEPFVGVARACAVRRGMEPTTYDVGRGDIATADMKARLAALRGDGTDWLDVLWERNRRANLGEGYDYGFATEEPDAL